MILDLLAVFSLMSRRMRCFTNPACDVYVYGNRFFPGFDSFP
jgi:hypothetical protein